MAWLRMVPKWAKMGQPSISPRQALFVASLALGKSRAEAARFASVSERTGKRWASLPTVRAELRSAQAEMMARAAHLAASEASASLHALADVRDDGEAPVSVRVMACRALLENCRALHEDFGLSERIAELESEVFGADAQDK